MTLLYSPSLWERGHDILFIFIRPLPLGEGWGEGGINQPLIHIQFFNNRIGYVFKIRLTES